MYHCHLKKKLFIQNLYIYTYIYIYIYIYLYIYIYSVYHILYMCFGALLYLYLTPTPVILRNYGKMESEMFFCSVSNTEIIWRVYTAKIISTWEKTCLYAIHLI